MKKSKKLLLGAISAMSLVAVGTGAVSTLAWFQASQAATAAVTDNTNDTIQVVNNATIEGIQIQIPLVFGFEATKTVDITAGAATTGTDGNDSQVIGTTYLIDQNGKVKAANNQASLVKSREVVITADNDNAKIKKYVGDAWVATTSGDRAQLNGKVLTMQMAASDQLRIAKTRSGKVGENDNNNFVGAYTAGTQVTLGTITIGVSEDTVSYTYASATDNATDGLHIFYSASPKNATGTSNEATGVSYGTLTVSIASQQ